MKSLQISKFLFCFFGIILLLITILHLNANETVDWTVEFETIDCALRVNQPKEFDLTIKNLRISHYQNSVHVVSSDPKIVQVSNSGFVDDFFEGTWRGTFIANPVGVGNVKISVEVERGSYTELSSERMTINVHRNRIVKSSSWIIHYTDRLINIVFYVTIGMTMNWRKWYDIVQRPAGLCDAFCVNTVLMLLVSKNHIHF